MKNLVEMKRLARMARNIGQPDLALEEAIAREEKLAENLFNNLFKTDEKPIVAPVLEENNLFTEEPKIEVGLVEAAALSIKAPKSREATQSIAISNEITKLRSQLADIMKKIGTMSWGGGGTGVVRFTDLDDHQNLYDVNSIHFNTTGPDANSYVAPGTLAWNSDEDCLNVYQLDSTLQVGLEQYIRVYNHSGNTINQGTLVMFSGVEEPEPGHLDHSPTVVPYIANGDYPPLYIVGVMTNDMANTENGRATTFGKVRGIDTTGASVGNGGETWQLGDLLWASPQYPGKLTKVQPTAPELAVSVAAVMHVHPTEGELLVRPTIFPRLHSASFSDTQTQNCAAANTATAVTFNTIDFTDGFTVINYQSGTNNAIQTDSAGLFNFQFSLQLSSSAASRAFVWIWMRKNGVDIPNSTGKLSIESNGGVIVPSWNFVVSMERNDNIQLMWATDTHNKVDILAALSTAFCPDIPSAILTVTQVNL